MRKFFLPIFILSAVSSFAQLGGSGVYNFLNLQPSARIAALGGNAINNPSTDLHLAAVNPSLLNKNFHNQAAFSYVGYLADIGAGYAGFTRHSDSLNMSFAGGIQFVNYGNFKRWAPDGTDLGTFSAGEYALHATAARTYNQFQVGASVKLIYSNLESYNSLGIASDLAATWFSKNRLMVLTAVASNVGTQIKTYTNATREEVPMNLQLGFSRKFEHNPLRIGIVAQHLESAGKLLYQIQNRNNNNIDLETGLPIQEDFSFLQHVMSHMIINTEIVLSKNFNIRVGYNQLRRRELALTDRKGLSGYSWGFGIKISKFQIHYGSGSYLIGRNTNHFSIVTNLNDFNKKSKQKQ
ncbi:type IX secretion system protein PorQ [Bacteroidota bacterium]